MRTSSKRRDARFPRERGIGAFLIFGAFLLAPVRPVGAATPASGTVSEGVSSVTWKGPLKTATAGTCSGPSDSTCDDFLLDIVPPSAAFGPYLVQITLQPALKGDWDLVVFDPTGAVADGSGNSPGQQEIVTLVNPAGGVYTVAAAPFAPLAGLDGVSYTANATLSRYRVTPAAPGGADVHYAIHPAPNGLGADAGEPSIGVDWKTGRVLLESYTQTLRITLDDCASPAAAKWEDKSAPSSVISLDPILFTDSRSGRTFVSQLVSGNGLGAGCSLSSYSDDDGDTWIPSEGCGTPAGADHQTIGGGPFAAPLTRDPSLPAYPDAAYYCSQAQITAFCARSDDGGLTYGPGVPIFTSECSSLHGHIKVGPDGTVYVPNKGCGGQQGVVVSEDNGLTWSIRTIPDSIAGANDPSVAVAADGTVYFGFQSGGGRPMVAVSHDHGKTWSGSVDVGAPFGIQNTAFPAVVAGDANRAAFAFLGTPTAGSFQGSTFTGIWHLYVAHTYDGGATWTTADATPGDPVQRGCIWLQGGSNTCRNLLDFMDATVDREGRVLVAFADGCIGDCVAAPPNSYTALATLARQDNGPRLFASQDSASPPAAPQLSATSDAADPSRVHLAWSHPDDHGSPVTGYRVYRSSGGGPFALVATPGPDVLALDDNVDSGVENLYKVTAVNANGEGPACREISPSGAVVVVEDPCKVPGKTVQTDPSGDQTGAPTANSQLDIRTLQISEPYTGPNEKALTLTLKVDNLQAPLQPNSEWQVGFLATDTGGTARMVYVDMNTNDQASGTVFEYGYHDDAGNTDVSQGGGGPVAGTFSSDGTITIVLSTASTISFHDLTGAPVFDLSLAPGALLSSIQAKTALLAGAVVAGTGGGLIETADSTTGDGTYAVLGNASCAPNSPPVAALSASPPSGPAPLTVDFDGSASSDPDGDPIASYTFDFGDGSPAATQSAPSASHTYASAGDYTATLRVTDARGAASAEAAAASISVSSSGCAAIALSPGSLPEATAGVPYSVTVSSSGGTAPYSYSATGTLPGGISLDSATGALSGTPAAAGAFAFTITATDSTGCAGSQAYTMTVTADLRGAARFLSYTSPEELGNSAGEPSIGIDWNPNDPTLRHDRVNTGGVAFFTAGDQELRVSFDDCFSPARSLWEDVSTPLVQPFVLTDPIGFVDRTTGRAFYMELVGGEGNSLAAFSDDDGKTFLPMQGGGNPAGPDHETLGAGPYNETAIPAPVHTSPNAVYYCSQNIVAEAECSRSDDGGVTFGPSVLLFDPTQCTGGIHGHVKVAPDGTVYVPNYSCDTGAGTQGLAVSTDNGVTWTDRTVPGSTGPVALVDPSVGIASDGTLYFGWQGANGHPYVALSHDRGITWENTFDAGASAGIQNSTFPVVAAGDPGRAAFGFLGTPTGGNYQNHDPVSGFKGVWHFYVATTFDGGRTWTTADATPNDPVQIGSICNSGTTACGDDRNLLDFNDMTIDREGRIVAAYADGCVYPACTAASPPSASRASKAAIIRQSGGRRLFAVDDPIEPVVAGAPQVAATVTEAGVHLEWPAGDDGGAPITDYRVYRRTEGESSLEPIADVGTSRSYDDSSVQPGSQYFYAVSAINAAGESPICAEVAPVIPPDPCHLPGATLVTDPAGDELPPDASLDILSASVAEPNLGGEPDELVWTLQLAGLATLPPDHEWYVIWDYAGELRRYVAAKTDSNGLLTYEYGHVGPPLDATAPDPDANKPFPEGAADAGSYDPTLGTFTITIANGKVGGPAAGDALANISPRTFAGNGEFNVTGSTAADSTSFTPTYVLRGNASCGGAARPTARGDQAETGEGVAVTIPVLANDSDGGAPPLQITAVSGPMHGSAAANADGTVSYAPDAGFNSFQNGPDTFTYTVKNAAGGTSSAGVSVTVDPFCPTTATGSFQDSMEPSSAPGWQTDTAVDNLGIASPSWQVTTDPLAHSPSHSWYSDATTLDAKDDRLIAPPQNLSPSSQLVFWHRYQFEASFDGGVLEVSRDGGATWTDVLAGGGSFAEGGYDGFISGSDGSPVAGRAAWTEGGDAASAMTRVVVNLGAFSGTGVLLRWRLAADPLAVGSLPGAGWWIDDVQFTNTLELSICNRPPVARDDSAGTVQNAPVTVNVLANDSDPDDDPLTVESVSSPGNGSATNNGDGTVTYTPAPAFLGTDHFSYKENDGQGHTATATVTVAVSESPNHPPTAADDSAATTENTAVVVDVLSNDTDPDGDSLTVESVASPANGSATDNGDGTVTYSPNTGFTGNDAFSYTVSDGRGGTASAAVNVAVNPSPNSPPSARDDGATTTEGTPVAIDVLANDSDPDGDPLTVESLTSPANGSAADNGDGSVTYSPNAGFTGNDAFAYTVSDGRGGSSSANVYVTVQPASSSGKATGSGAIPDSTGRTSRFGFNGSRGASGGRVTYDSGDGSISLQGTIQSLALAGPAADFSGPCTLGKSATTPCTYSAHAEDNGEPGKGVDRFSIRISDAAGSLIREDDGLLETGNVTVRP